MKLSFLTGTCLVAAALGAQAQETGLPLWEAGLLGGVATSPSYPAAADRTARALVLPYLVYRGEVLRADRSGFGARLAHTDNLEFDVGFAASLPARSTDTEARREMPDLGTLIEFGPRLKMTLARLGPASRVRLEVPLRTVLEFNNGLHGQGVVFEPELIYETRDVGVAGWSMSASGSVVVGDRKLNNYFYGVAPQFATSTRAAYEAQAGLIATRLALSTSKDLNADVRVFGFVRLESYAGAANQSSPLHRQSSGASVGLALAWTLGRSERRASSQP
jgi:outer membrane scaffolding protein for murein synthesis (MipA/OmpV family)